MIPYSHLPLGKFAFEELLMILSNSNTLLPPLLKITPLILLVDDDYDNLFLNANVVSFLKLKYLVAANAKNALDLAMDKRPDLILLDIVMPELDGITTTRLLKACPLTNHIPIIAVTGLTLPKEKLEIKNAGCDDYIPKPFLIEELEAKINDHLY